MATMNENDPRVKRTRDLIINAFISEVSKKGFESITVKDITTTATINRTTFYAHFTDKYDLLDTLIAEKFSELLSSKIQEELSINEHSIRNLVLCLCDFFEMIKATCDCGYISILPLIGNKITEELYSIIYTALKIEPVLAEHEIMRIELISTMISTSIYNAVYRWKMQKTPVDQEILIQDVIDFILTGIKNKL
ncbi:TetR family transcriptional regulator [Clostridium sp. 'White wine YQ']|uniref:TetR family transcriptional regulator n=1 Tax=Clostridium sp. 'White wine YQ' TaxID=3027474 RepID=UPI0023668278|nr:TetR family transcriptional regulator [Clostridium sp. 'White wine YQ']MDD7793474.1 TetR family transcriptional regulator [Clostridium sp. 'White wine YQ']